LPNGNHHDYPCLPIMTPSTVRINRNLLHNIALSASPKRLDIFI
jgi:hypothetical protein